MHDILRAHNYTNAETLARRFVDLCKDTSFIIFLSLVLILRFHRRRCRLSHEATAILKSGKRLCRKGRSQVLPKERQQGLVAAFVLGLDSVVAQVGASSHPAVDLVGKGLNVLGNGEGVLKLLDVFGGLVARGEQDEGNLDAGSVGGVDHGRVHRGSSGKGVGRFLDGQSNGLPAPTVLCHTVSGFFILPLLACMLTPRTPTLVMEELLVLIA